MAQIRWLLSEAGLIDGIQLNYDAPYSGLCMAYFNGDYPTPLYDYEEQYQASLKKKLGGIDMENAYSKAGVNVEAGYEVVERIQKHSQNTTDGNVGHAWWFWWLF